MSTGYSWEGIRQVCAALLGARHVPEHLCGGPCLQRDAITSVRPLPSTFKETDTHNCLCLYFIEQIIFTFLTHDIIYAECTIRYRLSICPSRGGISQKRLKLGSCNFHHRVAQSL